MKTCVVTLLLLLLLCVKTSAFYHMTQIMKKNVSTKWNDDLEPELEKIMKRIQREVFPIANEIIYDEAVSQDCLQTFARIMNGLSDYKPWAMKFFDASGGLVPNIVEGRMGSMGSYDECLSIEVPNRDDPTVIDAGGKYCTLSIRMQRQPMVYKIFPKVVAESPLLQHYVGNDTSWVLEFLEKLPIGFRLGVCLPSTCQSSIIPHLVKKFGGRFGLRADVLSCRDSQEETTVLTGTYISVVTLILITGIVTVATVMDCWSNPKNQGWSRSVNPNSLSFESPCSDRSTTKAFIGLFTAQSIQLIRCFSVKQSYHKLTDTEANPETQHLDCIYGIRVLSSLWVLFSHTFGGDPAAYDRPYHVLEVLQGPAFSLVCQGVLAVETFFTLTGILLYRTVLLERRKTNSPTMIFALLVILRRAFRLVAPAMGTIVLLYLLPLITSGPGMDTFFYKHFVPQCDAKWWSIPLFVNNFWTVDDNCLPHLWYLAADMQLLCILLLPVILVVSRPRRGLGLVALMGILGVLYTVYLIYVFDVAPAILILPQQMMKSIKYGLHLHVQSLPNLAPVSVGVIGGYLIEHHRNVKLPRSFFVAGWIAVFLVSNSVVFAVFIWHRSGLISTGESLIYGSLYRPVWAACVVWTVYACAAGGGQAIRWCLNRSNLVILSRLSCCFYLVSILMVMIKNLSSRTVVPFTYFQNFRDAAADAVFSYLLAFLLFLLFEAPAYALDKFVNAHIRNRKSTSNGDKNRGSLKCIPTDKIVHEVKHCVLPC